MLKRARATRTCLQLLHASSVLQTAIYATMQVRVKEEANDEGTDWPGRVADHSGLAAWRWLAGLPFGGNTSLPPAARGVASKCSADQELQAPLTAASEGFVRNKRCRSSMVCGLAY